MSDQLATYEIRNQPGWLHRNDATASNYQAVWIYPASPTTPYRSPDSQRTTGRYLLLDPRFKDADGRPGQDEWWFILERDWTDYLPTQHGKWGADGNFHNVAGDAGPGAGVGWGFGSGVSALALHWLPANPAPGLCIMCAYESQGGGQHLLPVPAPGWHTYVVRWIAGRTDGSTPRRGEVDVWVDGNDKPHLSLRDLHTVQRAQEPDGSQWFTQRWMQLWEGDYTSALPVESRKKLALTRIGRTLAEALADRPYPKATSAGGYYRVWGDAPEPSAVVIAPRLASQSRIPASLGGTAEPVEDLGVFRERFLPRLGVSTLYAGWRETNCGRALDPDSSPLRPHPDSDVGRWDEYAAAVVAGRPAEPPDLTTPFGDALVAAARMAA